MHRKKSLSVLNELKSLSKFPQKFNKIVTIHEFKLRTGAIAAYQKSIH